MNTAIVASNVLLWITVILLMLAVLGLSRQVGVLLERVAPAGALMTGKGLKSGETAPEMDLRTLDGDSIRVGGPHVDQRSTLIFFLSPTCPLCDTVVPAVRSLARAERDWLDVVLASDGDDADHEGYVERKRLQGMPYVVSQELGLRCRVGQLPHAVLIDERGIVAAAGLINTREHLDSLLEAKRRGVASLQEYLKQRSQPET
ncbi:MAG: methylamine dehydrogenase accessory protein MauD [Dehalococcoidia bacterium]